MNISAKIDQIIALRKSKIKILKEQKERYSKIKERVAEFDRFKSMLRNNPEKFAAIQGNQEIINGITAISTEDFHSTFNNYMTKLDQMIKRLGRDNLNISFVGRAGQGKSLVMQRISGLNGDIIPASDGSDCTGTKSVIHNCSGSKVVATINFFNESEMVGNVNKYIDKINNGSKSSIKRINSVSEIPNIDILSIRSAILMDDVESKSILEHLSKYVEHYSDYSPYLGEQKTVSESEIERYVAQYKNGNPSEKYFLYLGVKFADIMCSFPHSDTGKIELVDTIGIGTTSLATEEKMLDTVENDSDAIIFMFRPDAYRPRISSDEIDVIKKISARVTPEYSKEMLFWVINRVNSGKGQNSAFIPDIVRLAERGDYPVAKVLDVDCFSDDEVEKKLLVPVLEQLASRIEAVDKMLIEKLNKLGEDSYSAYHQICNGTEKALANSASEDMKRQFYSKIGKTNAALLNKLRDLFLIKYNELRNQPCVEFEEASNKKLKNITTKCIPSKTEIIEMLCNGNKNQLNVYEDSTNIMRIKIIDDFNELNNVLNNVIENMKKEVLHILSDSDSGELSLIEPFDDSISSSEWITRFLEKTNAEEKYPILADALMKFNEYSINVQGFLIHEIRNQLDPIDSALSGSIPTIYSPLSDKEAVAHEIIDLLQECASTIKEHIDHQISALNIVPNLSMFAAIKDLYDRLTYAGGNDETQTQWRYLYEDWMHLIWKDEYEAKSGLVTVAKQWNELVSQLKDNDNQKYFVISQD